MVEPASPIVAMAISYTTHSADVSELWLRQVTHSGRFEGISTGSPVGTSPLVKKHGPLAMSALGFNSKKERFLYSQLWLGLDIFSYKTPGFASPRKGS